jgi:hypothetical protein
MGSRSLRNVMQHQEFRLRTRRNRVSVTEPVAELDQNEFFVEEFHHRADFRRMTAAIIICYCSVECATTRDL